MPRPPPKQQPWRKKIVDPGFGPSRARGALLGMAVGDALGAPHEMKRLVAPLFPQLCKGPHAEMMAGGPHTLKPGQVKSDTQLACALAQSLKTHQRYDTFDVATRYLAWKAVAFDANDHLTQVFNALNPQLPFAAAQDVWIQSIKKATGNGSLGRTAPIGAFFVQDQRARIEASLDDCALTHTDPRCQLACVMLNAAIAYAARTPGAIKPAELLNAAVLEMNAAAVVLGRRMVEHIREVQDATLILKEDLATAQLDDPKLYGPELHLHNQPTSVRVAFRLAFWELFHAQSFEAGVEDAINRGGDADTNGAVTGALLGAFHGEAQIPPRWSKEVLEVLGGTFQKNPFWDTYHPRKLLELLS